jgi:hypothetical protein
LAASISSLCAADVALHMEGTAASLMTRELNAVLVAWGAP